MSIIEALEQHGRRVTLAEEACAELTGFAKPDFHQVVSRKLLVCQSICIIRGNRTGNPAQAEQCEEEKALWRGLYLKCATWSGARGFFAAIRL